MRNNWTIGKKLMVSFMGMATLTLLLGAVAFYGASESEENIHELGIVNLPSVQSLLEISREAERIGGIMNTLAIAGLSREARNRQFDALAASRERYEASWETYEALPQQEAEARAWREFQPAWNAWRAENNRAVELYRGFDQIGIWDPGALQGSIEAFRADHYALQLRFLEMLETGDIFEGGENFESCTHARWVENYQTDNTALSRILGNMHDYHRQVHQAVAQAKQLMRENRTEEAREVYVRDFVPAATNGYAAIAGVQELTDEAIEVLSQAEQQILGPVANAYQEANALLNQVVDIYTTYSAQTSQAAVAQAGFLKGLSIIAVIVGVSAAIALGILISRGINKSLRQIADNLSGGAEQTASAANQVSSASQSLAQGASEQASAIEETTSSVEEMASMARQNADSANQASKLMNDAKEVVGGMARATDEMSQAITEIKESSDKTAKIIKTIDEIAFQTNLLALNAAVEAARAGEAGKGFAVVAEEVRNLAQRSAEAARDTAAMIEGSVKNADNGVQVTERVTEALKQTVESSQKVSQLISEIAAASQEQAQGIDQINTAVGQMDQVTQTNAANAEESASASEELSAQAEELNNIVSELMALVGGAGSGAAASGGAYPARSRNTAASRHASGAVPTPARMPASRKPTPDQRMPGGVASPARLRATGNANPEDVIPMDSDQELAKF